MPQPNVNDLVAAAKRIKTLLSDQARRAYVLEITGTPKAGKTSTIAMVEDFLKGCDWKVLVLREQAAVCPIPMKGHFFFNTWTTCQMLASVLDAIEQRVDLIIVDRGFFDALIWLELQLARKQVDATEAEAFTSFLLLKRWRQLVDASVVMTVSPETAMQREQLGRIVPRRGSLMNPEALAEVNDALAAARRKHGVHFQLIDLPSDHIDEQKGVATDLIAKILPMVEAWVDPAIAVMPMAAVDAALAGRSAVRGLSDGTWDRLAATGSWRTRSEAENDSGLVQLVACGLVRHGDGAFVFDRSLDPKRLGEYGRDSFWKGAHVAQTNATDLVEHAKTNLTRRLTWELHLKFPLQPEPIGIVWVPDENRARSRQHLGLFFEVRIDDPVVANSLEQKEFKTSGRGHPARSRFTKPDELPSDLALEPWSAAILENQWLTATTT